LKWRTQADVIFFFNIQSLLDNIQKDITRAERDNDLIYHQDVPPSTALPPIQDVNMVNSVVPAGLKNLDVALGNEPMIFGELPSWAAREAISDYLY
jgi:programmed cell death 6-interacting protein